MIRRAALYARVSTRHQEQEATIESQLARLLSYAQQQGYEVPPERQFIDQAVSGHSLVRPGLDRLRDAAVAGAFQVLLCLSPDRLTRNLGAQYMLLQELRRHGVEVLFLNQPRWQNEPETQLLLNFQGAFAEYERVLISERMRRGRRYRLQSGQSAPYPAPYGYRYCPAMRQQSSRWEIVPEQAVIVQQIFLWYTEAALTIGQIVQRLNEAQVPGPRGGRWTSATVGRMLRQPAYKGITYYSRHRSDWDSVGEPRKQGRGRRQTPRQVLRPVDEWIAIAVPAIVSESLWEATQGCLKMRTRFARRNSRRTYLLRGLLVCGVCGYTLQGRTQKGTVTYVCTHGGKHCPPGIAHHTCTIRADLIEPLVWEALSQLLGQPERIQEAWEALQACEQAVDERSRGLQRQAALQKQRQRLIDAYQAGVLSLEELVERQNPLELELQTLKKRLQHVSEHPPAPISLARFTQRIQRALTACDPETQQEVLRLLIERIVVTDDAITIEHIVPTEDDSRLYHAFRKT